MLDPGVSSVLFSRVSEFTPATYVGGLRCGVGEEVPTEEDEVATGDVERFYLF